MSRISGVFAQLREQGRQALIPFVTAGDPDLELTLPLMHAMVEAGADIIELGVPFSDPMADGPVIQRASERALAKGVTLISYTASAGATSVTFACVDCEVKKAPIPPRGGTKPGACGD